MSWGKSINLFVPRVGTMLKLSKAWTFPLYHETRNAKLLEANGTPYDPRLRSPITPVSMTLPKDTELKVDRVYIRNFDGAACDYDSITFVITSCPANPALLKRKTAFNRGVRFWVKLDDANTMKCLVDDSRKPDDKKNEIDPRVTDELCVGNIVTRDYNSLHAENQWFTHKEADRRLIVVAIEPNGDYRCLDMFGNDANNQKGKFYLVKGYVGANVRQYLIDNIVNDKKKKSWSKYCKWTLPQIEQYVDAAIKGDYAGKRKAEWQGSGAFGDLVKAVFGRSL